MTDGDSFIGVHGCLPMLMNLGKQSTDLHVGFALVLQKFEEERGLFFILKESLDLFGVQEAGAVHQAFGTFV